MQLNVSHDQVSDLVRRVKALPVEIRGQASTMLQIYAKLASQMLTHGVVGCALGFHPDEHDELVPSVLTVSQVNASGPVGTEALVSLAATRNTDGRALLRPVLLACGTGFLSETEGATTHPRSSTETSVDLSGTTTPYWQGTVLIPMPRS